MRRILLAVMALSLFSGVALADSFWVVGNRKTNRCEIVTRNPIIDGDLWFEDGPYKSKDDAKLAITTIRVCPPYQEPEKSASDSNAKMLR